MILYLFKNKLRIWSQFGEGKGMVFKIFSVNNKHLILLSV